TMEECVLATWHKKEGDSVEVDDLLAEVETDKATMEFRAFDKGTILKLLVEPGATVKLGQAVAVLGEKGEDVSALVAKAGGGDAPAPKKDAPEPEKKEEKPAKTEDAPTADDKKEPADDKKEEKAPAKKEPAKPAAPVDKGSLLSRTERDAGPPPSDAGGKPSERVLASPYVRKVARERGIDLASASGSGEHGRIVPGDLEKLARGEPKSEAAASPNRADALAKAPGGLDLAAPEVRKLSPMRKTIARRLTQSKQTVPHFYLTIDVDAEELSAMRERINAELAAAAPKAKPGVEPAKPEKISINDLLIKAVAGALQRVPECNAQFTAEAILVHTRIDISVAVAIPDGLVTPVVRNADQKSVVAIAREVRDLAARARIKKLKPEEMSDGTFSISNLGMFGIDEFAAVINPPEGAILAVGAARDEPVVRDGQVVAGKKMAMTLSCDHRVVDGAVGAAFLAELRSLLEHPMRILSG
ncbi:MAG: hypothetical protein JWP97_1037, partial [Labilithrix sp.]|nr:hypothetical protein [Labilithrix sp.]